MKVRLPRPATGEEIVGIFTEISTYFAPGTVKLHGVTHSTTKLCGKEYVGEYEYRPGSVLQAVRTKGALVRPWHFVERGIFRKRVRFEENTAITFNLHPLKLDTTYNEVEVEITFYHDEDQTGWCCVTKDPLGPRYEEIRPLFERILFWVFERLTPQTAL